MSTRLSIETAPARNLPAVETQLLGAACPACGTCADVWAALTHAYAVCRACGWQRRTTQRESLDLLLHFGGYLVIDLAAFLAQCAARPLDSLPPCPALLWHQVAPGVYAGPSASIPDKFYEVTIFVAVDRPQLRCTCPNGGRSCWHTHRAGALHGYTASLPARAEAIAATVVPAIDRPVVSPPVAAYREKVLARSRAALADLYGPACDDI